MTKLTLDLPDDVAEMLKALGERLDRLEADKTGAEPAISERDIDAVTRAIALSLKRRSLRGLNIDSQRVVVDGVPHQRVGEHEAAYYTKEGPVATSATAATTASVASSATTTASFASRPSWATASP